MPKMALPPGAELVSSNEMKLPPGAEIVGKGVYASPGRKPGQAEANQKYIDENSQHDADGFLASAFKTSGLQGLWDAANAIHEGRAPVPGFEHPLMTGLRMIGAIPGQLKETGEKVGQQLADENYSGAAGSVAGLVAPLLVPGAAKSVTESAPMAVAKAAVKAGGPKVALGVGKIGLGAGVDMAEHALGLPPNAASSLYGIVKGGPDVSAGLKAGYSAGKEALSKFRELQRQAQQPGRPLPAWISEPDATVAPPDPPSPPSAPPVLPSGRKPGGIQNQQTQTASVPAEVAAAVAGDPLDTIAADLGYKKPYSKLTASQQMEVKVAMKVAEQEAAKAAPGITGTIVSEPDPPPPIPFAQTDLGKSEFGAKMQKAMDRLKGKGEIPQDYDPSFFGGPDEKNKVFDTGSGGPVIDSNKSRWNKPTANPHLIEPEILKFQIDRLKKKPNRTPGETNLLNQLSDEAKKRGIK